MVEKPAEKTGYARMDDGSESRSSRGNSSFRYSGKTDLELVRQCKDGDDKAFEELFYRYRGKVYGIAFGITGNKEDSLDVVQEVFAKVFKFVGSFKGESSFYTWLYRIAVNLSIDCKRKRKRDREVEFTDTRKSPEESDSVHSNPGDEIKRKEMMEKLKEAIDTLPDYHRDVIVMREIGGFSYEEIARVTGVSRGTVMSRLFHARRKLRRKMEKYMKEL